MDKFKFYSKKCSFGLLYLIIKLIQFISTFGSIGVALYLLGKSIYMSVSRNDSLWTYLISSKNSPLIQMIVCVVISIVSFIIFRLLKDKIEIIGEKKRESYSFHTIKSYMQGNNQNGTNSFLKQEDAHDSYEDYSLQFEPEEIGITKSELDSYKKIGSVDPEEDLNKLIGLERVKRQVRIMNARMQDEAGNKMKISSGNHMCFLGPSGTGKTTVARIMTGILYKCGYIKQNKCIEVNGQSLKGMYSGQTGKRTQTIVNAARGGVLFIDEAYILSSGRDDGYGDEAIGVLLQAMENNKDDFVVILAGYDDEIDELLRKNPGFTSRIKHKIRFDNYTNEEMTSIFKMYAKDNGFKLNDDAFDALCDFLPIPQMILDRHFGNIRYIRTFLDKTIDCHYDNYTQGLLDEADRRTLCLIDIQATINIEMDELLRRDFSVSDIDFALNVINIRLSQNNFSLRNDAELVIRDFINGRINAGVCKLSSLSALANRLIKSQIKENEKIGLSENKMITKNVVEAFLNAQF